MSGKPSNAQALMDQAARKALREALRQMLPEVAEEALLLARIRRAHYEASIKEGFSPDQALALCMKPSFGG